MGPDQLPGGQRDRAAALGLADGAVRPQAVLHDLRLAVHGQLGPLRRGAEHRVVDRLPGPPGAGRRRPPALGAGHPGRYLPTPATGHGDGDVRRGRRGRADPRTGAGRLHQRQLLLAVDLLHQHPHRHRLFDPDQPHRPGSSRHGRGGPAELEAQDSRSITSAWAWSRSAWARSRSSTPRARSGTGSATRSGGPRPSSSRRSSAWVRSSSGS